MEVKKIKTVQKNPVHTGVSTVDWQKSRKKQEPSKGIVQSKK